MEECFPFDYLRSHDILLEFILSVHNSHVEQRLNEHLWLAELVFKTVLQRNQNDDDDVELNVLGCRLTY